MTDRFGLAVTTASPRARERYDAAVRGLLEWNAEATVRFEAALEDDPALAVTHAGLAVCYVLEERFADARAAAGRARELGAAQSERERSHVEALALYVTGQTREAELAMREHLQRFPRDLVVAQRLYFVCFWQGRFPDMLGLTTDLVARANGTEFLLGLHAFALEEADRLDEALAAAEEAIAANPRDGWAVHAYAHTLYEMAAFARGVRALPPAIHPCTHLGYFRKHLLWHLALMHLSEGRVDRARAMAWAVFEREPSSIPGNLHDSISLLWRLQLCGAPPDRARWAPFAAIAADRLDRQALLFHAVHLAMALAAAGDWATADRQVAMLRQRAVNDRTGLVADVVLPLVEGLQAFVGGDYARTIARLEPLRPRFVELGGSRAQRDLFHDTLLEACFRADDGPRAERLLAERVARRPDRYWIDRRS